MSSFEFDEEALLRAVQPKFDEANIALNRAVDKVISEHWGDSEPVVRAALTDALNEVSSPIEMPEEQFEYVVDGISNKTMKPLEQ